MSGKEMYAGMILTYRNDIHYLLLVIDACYRVLPNKLRPWCFYLWYYGNTIELWEILSTAHILPGEETRAQRPSEAHTACQYCRRDLNSGLWDSKDEVFYPW